MEDRGFVQAVKLVEKGVFGSQINMAPLCSEEIKVRTFPIENTSTDRVQESLVVRDLLLVLQGCEGVYIRYNNSYRTESLMGPDYKVVKMMNVTFKSFSKRLIKVGSIYVKLNKFQEWCMDDKYGRVMHRLGHVIRQFLCEKYLECVKELEVRYYHDARFSIRDMETTLEEHIIYKLKLLDELVEWVYAELRRRSEMDRMEMNFQNFMNDLKEDKDDQIVLTDTRVSLYVKGGVVIEKLQLMMEEHYGDVRYIKFLNTIHDSLSDVYGKMFVRWMSQGDLIDMYDEFLVSDTLNHSRNQVNSINGERLWETRFVIRKDGLLPQFMDKDLQYKILMTGKLWDLYKTCCDLTLENNWSTYGENEHHGLPDGTELKVFVNKWYQRANQICYQMLVEGYNIPKVLYKLHSIYLYFGNSAFLRKFVHPNLIELTRSTNDNVLQKLRRSFENSCTTSDSFFQLISIRFDSLSFFDFVLQFLQQPDPSISNVFEAHNFQQLRNLLLNQDSSKQQTDANLQHSSSVFFLQLDTMLPYPLSIVITRPILLQYQLLNRYLTILHYHAKLLEDTWFELSKKSHSSIIPQSRDAISHQTLRCARILLNRMTNLLSKLIKTLSSPLSVQITFSKDSHSINQLCAAIQNHVSTVISSANLSSPHVILLHRHILNTIYHYVRYIASWRSAHSSSTTSPSSITSCWSKRRLLLARYYALWRSYEAAFTG